MKRMLVAGLASAMVLTGTAQTAAPAGVETPASEGVKWTFDGGVDFRIRYESFDNLPTGPMAGDFSYTRYRTRPWLSFGVENVSLYMRGAHEFRHVFDSRRNGNEFEDELVVDNLYLDVKGLFDGLLDLRVGRQDLIYGAGRVVLEGTPMDGSRTIFFDAVKAILHLSDTTTLDLFGIYNDHENKLVTGRMERQLTWMTGPFNEMQEKGAGLYLKNKSNPDLPFEAYYIWKRESDFYANPAQTVKGAGRHVHTVGTRLLPKFSDKLSGEFEVAGQLGRTDDNRDVYGLMAYAGSTYQLDPFKKLKPYLTGSVYYLSGDDTPDNSADHRWNPLWARYPQFNELALYSMTPFARWSNIVYPAVTLGAVTEGKAKLSLQTGPLFAEVDDNAAGRGHYRGWLGTASYAFPIISNLLGDSYGGRGSLNGTLYAECLIPGNYYAENVDKPAWFIRLELNAIF